MNKWLIKKLIIEKYNSDEHEKRLRCGRLSGAIGITMYFAFGGVKIFVGLITGSFAVMVDAIHNLADASASIATIIGFSLASKKSDEKHPFGHARIEYMTGFVVAAIIVGIGIELCITAFEKMKNPTQLNTDITSFVLIAILTLIVFWFSRFNIKLSKLINSASLKATSVEARNDAVTNIALLVVMLLYKFANVNIDVYIGLAVGAFIIYSGIKMAMETAGPLLGQSPAPEIVKDITDHILSHDGVLGIHDLIVHDYGPGHIIASVHIEVDSREDILKSHQLVDDIERKAQEKLRILLVGHMDPLDTQNQKLAVINDELTKTLYEIENVKNIHDLRIVEGSGQAKVIFDVAISDNDQERTFKKVEKAAQETLDRIGTNCIVVINWDTDYSSGKRDRNEAE